MNYTYNHACRACRNIDAWSRAAVCIAGGICIGYFIKPGWPQVICGLILLAVSQLAFWIVNKTQPMLHHMVTEQPSKEDRDE